MTQASITPEVHQALDIRKDFSAKITFNAVFCVDDLTDTDYVVFRELARFHPWVKMGFFGDLDSGVTTDAENRRQRDRYCLFIGEVYT